jgi:acyl dehydratase
MRTHTGDEIPPFVRTAGLMEWNRYAAVNDEFVPFHMDDEAGRAQGLPGAIGMGNLQVAYLHNLLRTWIGPNGRILAFACQHRAFNRKGDVLTCRGRVTAIRDEGGEQVVDLDIWVENDRGETLSPGKATVALPA